MGTPAKVSFEAIIKASTDRAVLVVIEGENHWLPLSQVTVHRDEDAEDSLSVGEEVVVDIPQWLVDARKIEG